MDGFCPYIATMIKGERFNSISRLRCRAPRFCSW